MLLSEKVEKSLNDAILASMRAQHIYDKGSSQTAVDKANEAAYVAVARLRNEIFLEVLAAKLRP